MGTRVKGLREMRTISRVSAGSAHSRSRHIHQFRIGTLELERARLFHEREVFLRRIGNIERRLLEIDDEILTLQTALRSAIGQGATRNVRATRLPGVARPRRTLRY